MAEFHGFWRFHTGDDPDGQLGWAQPDLDDSNWKLLRSDQHIGVQGYPGYSGMAWYRFRVLLPPNHPPLALFIPGIGYCASYQVFAGGRLIGQFGGLPPNQRVYWANCSLSQTPVLGQTMPIPARIADGKGSLVIAIRVWLWRDWAPLFSPVFEAPSIGDASLMDGLRQHRSNYEFWALSAGNALLLVYLLAALSGLGLFLLRRGESEYLWFAGFELFSAANYALNVYPAFHPVWFQGFEALAGLLLFQGGVCLSMFFVTLLKEKRGRLFWSMIGSVLFVSFMFVPVVMQWMNAVVWIPVIYLAAIPFIVCQILLLSLAARRGNLDARLLLGPFSMQYGVTLVGGLLFGLQLFGYGGSLIAFWAGNWDELFTWPFPISVQNIADFLCQISILAILVLRFGRTRRDEERFRTELEAARTVQQVLIPEEIPAIPGLALECIYKPAGQVGGDFFQILPIANHGALIVIGDVSGKGMPAAMAVSLLVGTVRTLAHYTQCPAEILAAMNQRMLARSKDGFTTCMVLRIDRDGSVTVSNAGHLAPYVGAQEFPVESGLPLGLAAEAVYTDSSFHLDSNQELTLLTDGVAEARAKTGELFGFERTASISVLSAEHIAATAKAFGQQDDITVLKIRRFPVPEPVGVPLAAVPSTSTA
ncbi:MAG TPA: SpoIIE family protein phosphatase [Terracidiphilus sp.]